MLMVFLRGLLQTEGFRHDYVLMGGDKIHFMFDLARDDVVELIEGEQRHTWVANQRIPADKPAILIPWRNVESKLDRSLLMITCNDCGYEDDEENFELGVDGHLCCPECDSDDLHRPPDPEEEDADDVPEL